MNQLAMSYKHGISKHKEKLFQLCFLLCKMISNFSKASKTGINYQMTHSLRITNTDSEEICTFFIGDNLYDTFKSVWGLSDEQIVGIYSDAGLQNKLATSTLITEDMVVYVVLEEGWSPIPPEMM